MKFKLSILLNTIICLSLILSSLKGHGIERRDGPGIVVGLEGNPTSLDPRFATDAYSERILPLIYNSLLYLDENLTLYGDLAHEWSLLDERTYLFRIKKGVRFHDGKELTSRDIKYTFDFIKNPRNLSPMYSAYINLQSIECVDNYTILFRLKAPYASFPLQLTRGIIPAHLGDRPGFYENPVGSGPFRLIRWKKGEEILLQAMENPHERNPGLRWIIFSVIPHTTTRLLEMKKGRIDLLQNSIPPYAVRYFQQLEGIKVIIKPGINYKYIGYNLRDPFLGNKKVRQALSFAIDRDSIIRNNLKGLARKATGILAPSHWAYEGNVMTYGYDPQRAKALLDEAGFQDPDGDGPIARFKLSLKTSTNRESNEIAQVIANQLRQVGIAVEKRGYEWGTFYSDIKKGNFQMYTLSWVGIYDPDIFYYAFHSRMIPPFGANRGYYLNPDLDDLIERSRVTLDRDALKNIYSKIQKIIAEDAVYTSLWYTHDVIAIRDKFMGFNVYPGGHYTSLKYVQMAKDKY